VDTGFANRSASYKLAAFSGERNSRKVPRARYCWSTGDAVDCAAPWRAGGAELRAGFFAGAGFTVVAVGFVSAGAPAAAGAVASSAGSTASI
jgi:hypothetical protein